MNKLKKSSQPKPEKQNSITMTHKDVQLEITFRETPPDTDVKQNIITMLTNSYQDKILS